MEEHIECKRIAHDRIEELLALSKGQRPKGYGRDDDVPKSVSEFLDNAYEALNTVDVKVSFAHPNEVSEASVLLACGGPNVYLEILPARVIVRVYWGFGEASDSTTDDALLKQAWEWIDEVWKARLEVV